MGVSWDVLRHARYVLYGECYTTLRCPVERPMGSMVAMFRPMGQPPKRKVSNGALIIFSTVHPAHIIGYLTGRPIGRPVRPSRETCLACPPDALKGAPLGDMLPRVVGNFTYSTQSIPMGDP